MKKEIRIFQNDKFVQITTVDERWYAQASKDEKTGLPIYVYVPSVTWIADHYPKGVGFYKWLANKGWDEAEAIKVAAGDKGSKVHLAISDLLEGKTIAMNALYINNSTGLLEELTLAEYDCLISFVAWYKKIKPKIIAKDLVVWNKEENYAGTLDFIIEIGERKIIVDIKTSQYVWPSHILQLSAYKWAMENPNLYEMAILQVGYQKNHDKYKLTEIDDRYDLFLAAKQIWANEVGGQKPLQRDYPLSLQLTETPKQEAKDVSKL